MKMTHTPLAMLVVAALFVSPANANANAQAQAQTGHHSGDLAAPRVADDPFAPV